MKTVFISIIFLFNDGNIVPGNQIAGYNDLQQVSMEVCTKRVKWFYANKKEGQFGPKIRDAVIFCYEK